MSNYNYPFLIDKNTDTWKAKRDGADIGAHTDNKDSRWVAQEV